MREAPLRVATSLLLVLALFVVTTVHAQPGATDVRDAAAHFSGQHRLLYGHTSAIDLGVADAAPASASVGLLRNLLGLQLRLSPSLRVSTQLGAHLAFGTHERAEPPDRDLGDVHLLFVEWTRAATNTKQPQLQLRAGRQELVLGSTRWFSSRDGTNVRQALDLLRLSLVHARFEAHGFAGLVPRLRRGWFDDAPELASRLFGGYATWHLLPAKQLSLDLFLVARYRPRTHYQDHAGREVRRTFGLRVFGETQFGLEYVVHGLVQWGRLEDADIRAWGAAVGLWQRLMPAPWELRFGVRADALSGDARRNDRVIGSFHPLFPNQAFFSTQPAVYPSNVYDLHPLLKLHAGALELELGCALFWRQRSSDAVYGAAGQALFWGEQSQRSFTGAQLSTELVYRATAELTTMVAYAQFLAGPGLHDAGGSAVRFFAASMTYTY